MAQTAFTAGAQKKDVSVTGKPHPRLHLDDATKVHEPPIEGFENVADYVLESYAEAKFQHCTQPCALVISPRSMDCGRCITCRKGQRISSWMISDVFGKARCTPDK